MSAGGREGALRERLPLGKLGCWLLVALLALSNLAAIFGAGAFIQSAVEHANRWTDFFSPSFCWEYAQTPLGATLCIISAVTSVLGLTILAIWTSRARRD